MLSWLRYRRLLGKLKSRDDETKGKAIDALAALGNKRAVPALLRLLGECDLKLARGADLARNIIHALGRLGDRRAAGPILQLAQSKSPNLAAAAGQVLVMLDEPSTLTELLQHLRSRCDSANRVVGQQLARRGDPRAVPLLLQSLREPRAYDFEESLKGLGNLADARALGPLGAFLATQKTASSLSNCDGAICSILQRDAAAADEKDLRQLAAQTAIHYDHVEEYSYSYMEPGSRIERDYIRTPMIYGPQASQLAKAELERRGLRPGDANQTSQP